MFSECREMWDFFFACIVFLGIYKANVSNEMLFYYFCKLFHLHRTQISSGICSLDLFIYLFICEGACQQGKTSEISKTFIWIIFFFITIVILKSFNCFLIVKKKNTEVSQLGVENHNHSKSTTHEDKSSSHKSPPNYRPGIIHISANLVINFCLVSYISE